MEEPNCNQVGQIYDQDTNPINGRVYDTEGIAPTLRTPTGGNFELKIIEPFNAYEDGTCRTLKAQCGQNSAANFVRQDGLGATAVCEIMPINTDASGNSATITSHYHKAGASDSRSREEGNPTPHTAVMEIYKNKHVQKMEENKEIKGVSVHPLGRKMEFDGKFSEEVSPCLRATDYKAPHCVWEAKILTQRRTEKGRELRKQGVDVFANKELVPREDGVSGTLTSVQKDNLLVEPQVIGSMQENAYRGSTDGVAPCVNAAMGMGGGHVPMVTEGMEYKGRMIKEGDGFPAHNSETFGTNILEGISPTLRAEKADAATCVKEGVQYRIRKLTERECFRLMDVSEEDIDKMLGCGISKSAAYRLAGNSICVSPLYFIFKNLFITKEKPIQGTLF